VDTLTDGGLAQEKMLDAQASLAMREMQSKTMQFTQFLEGLDLETPPPPMPGAHGARRLASELHLHT
jgi:hypothetical protein